VYAGTFEEHPAHHATVCGNGYVRVRRVAQLSHVARPSNLPVLDVANMTNALSAAAIGASNRRFTIGLKKSYKVSA